MAASENKLPVTGAGPLNGLLTWVDQRFPLLTLPASCIGTLSLKTSCCVGTAL